LESIFGTFHSRPGPGHFGRLNQDTRLCTKRLGLGFRSIPIISCPFRSSSLNLSGVLLTAKWAEIERLEEVEGIRRKLDKMHAVLKTGAWDQPVI
jgi:hypothetical protein